MTHGQLRAIFIKYHQEKYPERRIFDNRTGWAVYKKQHVPYGIPAPVKGKRGKLGGGGSDLISFAPGMIARFYELKTKKDNLRPNQKWFADWVISMQGEYWIVKEDDSYGLGFRFLEYKNK